MAKKKKERIIKGIKVERGKIEESNAEKYKDINDKNSIDSSGDANKRSSSISNARRIQHAVSKSTNAPDPKALKKAIHKAYPELKKNKPSREKKIHTVMKEFKEGKLPKGNSNKKVTSRKQAIAIAFSEAGKSKEKREKKKKK